MTPIRPKYGQTILYLLLLAGVVTAMSLTRKCSSANTLPLLQTGNSGKDTVDIAITYGPSSYYIYGDTLGGINLDILKQFSQDTGHPIKFWPVANLHDALVRLKENTYDILASIPNDGELRQNFQTTKSIFLDKLVLVQLRDSSGDVKVKSSLDLAGKTVHIQKNSSASMRLRNLATEIGDKINLVEEEELSDEYLCMMVGVGKIPLAVVNERIALKMTEKYPLLDCNNPVSFTQFQVWVLAPADTTLRTDIDDWLDEFTHTQRYRDIIGKY